MNNSNQFYKIKPAARIVTTIGEELIKDVDAAIVELVKNSYDADAKTVNITFTTINKANQQYLKIIISDNGHGMSFDTVVNKWMIPATNDKLKRKISPLGRPLQGRKGIGRYAAAILGEELFMSTVDENGSETTAYIDWKEFTKHEFLEEVNILVEQKKADKETTGTYLEMIGSNIKLQEWTKIEIVKLKKELMKLLSPIKSRDESEVDKFSIKLKFINFTVEEYQDVEFEIQPFSLIDLYDYRLYGNVSGTGITSLVFENKSAKGIPDERLNFNIGLEEGKYCGNITLDFRVFDREKEAIDNLIKKGLKDPDTGNYLNVTETRRLLNEISGIGIYRGDFRIRPYGDSGYDWLELDKARVQNPSVRIGSDQIAGFVSIEREELSNLEEKSARDGLKENKYYEALKEIAIRALTELEARRNLFRKKTLKGGRSVKVEKELNNLFDFSELTKKVENRLSALKLGQTQISEISEIIRKTEVEKSDILDNIKDTIAIYQGQATLGKIIMVVLHEGRRPLTWFKNTIPIISEDVDELKDKFDEQLLNEIIYGFDTGRKQGELLISLFNKLDPLSVKKRGKQKKLPIKLTLGSIFKIFIVEFEKNNIQYTIDCDNGITFKVWEEDIYSCFTNLIDNSLYWLTHSNCEKKEIRVAVFSQNGEITIDYRDNGPGIDEKYIEEGIIFEPNFSTKPGGTGLGLAIAGEAIERNNGKLKAIYSEKGAYFRVDLFEQKLDEANKTNI